MSNSNVMTEGDGRLSCEIRGNKLFVELVWDGCTDNELSFLIGARDAQALGELLVRIGKQVESQ